MKNRFAFNLTAMLVAALSVAYPAQAAEQSQPEPPATTSIGYSDFEPWIAAGLSFGLPIAAQAIGQPIFLDTRINFPVAALGAGSGQLLAGDPARASLVSLGGAAVVVGAWLGGVAFDEVMIPKDAFMPRKWSGIIFPMVLLPIYSTWAGWDAFNKSRKKAETAAQGQP